MTVLSHMYVQSDEIRHPEHDSEAEGLMSRCQEGQDQYPLHQRHCDGRTMTQHQPGTSSQHRRQAQPQGARTERQRDRATSC